MRYSRSRGRLAGAIIAVGVAYAGVAGAQSGTLSNPHHPLLWSGSVGPSDVPNGAWPGSCASIPCDRFDLSIDLPPGIFVGKAGGVQIALRWTNGLEDTIQLYVYQGTTLVAASEGIFSEGQSLTLREPANGAYQIYIASDASSVHPEVAYEALAEVEFDPKPNPERDLLPDLEARVARVVTFDTPSFPFFGWPEPNPGDTCFPLETQEQGAQTCLRYDSVIVNIGEGPLQTRLALPKNANDPSHNVQQRIFSSVGGYRDRAAGEWEFHPSHDHFHTLSFAQTHLWVADAAGNRQGIAPVRTGRKLGFCNADFSIDFWAEKGDGPRTYRAPDCFFPADSDANYDYLVQGITNGWLDAYDWFLPDQYIEVSGLPDGHYVLDNIVDPDGNILEANTRNNCTGLHIQLANVDSPSRSVVVHGPVGACL